MIHSKFIKYNVTSSLSRSVFKRLFLDKLEMTALLVFTFAFLSSQSSFAQPGEMTYSTTNQKAIKLYEEARGLFDQRLYEKALKNLNTAIEKDPKFIEPYLLIAEINIDQGKYELGIESYKKGFEVGPDYFPNNYFYCGYIELNIGRYDDCKAHMQKFTSYRNRNPEMIKTAELYIKNCDFATEAMKHPVPFNPINMGDKINSAFHEYFPGITADGQYFLFTRRLKNDDKEHPMEQEDFYVSKNVGGQWQQAVNMGPPINTVENEGAPTFAADGQVLIFAACENYLGVYGDDRKGFGSCDLFYSQKNGERWTKPLNMGTSINGKNWESQPTFSSDGKTLYFIRGVMTGRGVKDQDIWMSELQANGSWSKATKLSTKINTSGREESVFVHPDNQTLYFSSDGHPGMGGLDIYMSKRQPDGEWGTPVNLGYPINTYNDENSILVSGSGQVAYYASDRKGGLGGLDLYQFDLYKEAQPEVITYMKGKVYDAKTHKPLDAYFELIDLETNKNIVESTSNPGNGEFLVTLPSNKNYALNVSRKGYLFYSENFSLKDVKADINKPYLMDVPLQMLDTGVTVQLKNIFFETAKYDLKPESKTELQKLIAFLNNNPTLKIELSGHTDNVGDKKSNITLSQNRSKSVYDYLIANGIKAERLAYKGYGDSKPIVANDTPENRAKNRRTEFKVIGK